MAGATQADLEDLLAQSLTDRVTPYAKHAYSHQLHLKREDLKQMLAKFGTTLDKEISVGKEVAPTWYRQNKEMPLEEQIINCADAIDGYRNKVEFTVGRCYRAPQPTICPNNNISPPNTTSKED